MGKLKLKLGECKETLEKGLATLNKTLKERKDLSPTHKLKLTAAIVQMTVAHKVLKSVKCEQPEMSLEVPDPPPYPSARLARRRKSSKRR
jgi:hypothetical protein